GLDVNLFYKVTGKRPVYTVDTAQNYILSKYDAYNLADITVNKKLFKLLTLNVGVRNVFDVKSIQATAQSSGTHGSSASGRSIANGRSYFMGLLFDLQIPQKTIKSNQ